MSRTYRKRIVSYDSMYKDFYSSECGQKYLENQLKKDVNYLKRDKARYYSKTMKFSCYNNLPKSYRNYINKIRRRFDKNEIWKAVNIIDYPEQCSKWNCKDADTWGYW